ncbi:TolC family protein [Candidatus Latescibacterota bacterium]
MKKLQIQLMVYITISIIVYSFSSTLPADGALDSYKELESETFGDDSRSESPILNQSSRLSDYLAYAAFNNPQLEAAFNRWKAALEKIPQVRSLPDPRFSYAYYIENVETKVGPQRHKIDLSQTFPWFGKLELLGGIALHDANIQRQNYETLKLILFYKIKESYYEYYHLARALAITEENMKLMSYFENIARTKYSAGTATYADVIKAQVELGKLEERILSLNELKEPLSAQLSAALNRPFDEILPLPSALPEEDILLSDDEIITRTKEYNPDLKAHEFKISKDTESIHLAQKQYYPDITVGVSYIGTGNSDMPGTAESGKDPFISMMTINLPIWRNKYRSAVREAELRHVTSVKERDNRANSLIDEVKTVLYNFRDSERKVQLYRDTLILKAKQSLNVTQKAFETGNKDFLNLIDAQRTLLELELAYERALTDRTKHCARIEMLTGGNYKE